LPIRNHFANSPKFTLCKLCSKRLCSVELNTRSTVQYSSQDGKTPFFFFSESFPANSLTSFANRTHAAIFSLRKERYKYHTNKGGGAHQDEKIRMGCIEMGNRVRESVQKRERERKSYYINCEKERKRTSTRKHLQYVCGRERGK